MLSNLNNSLKALSRSTLSKNFVPLTKLNNITPITSTSSIMTNNNFSHTSARFFGGASSEPLDPSKYDIENPDLKIRKVPIHFIEHDGTRRTVMAQTGFSLLEVADVYDISILARCMGGGRKEYDYGEGPACWSCLVQIDTAHLDKVNKAEQREKEMIYWSEEATNNSRLACEVIVDESCANMTVVVPEQERPSTLRTLRALEKYLEENADALQGKQK